MIDNYNLVNLLNDYTDDNPDLIDIIHEIENKGVLQGTKI